MNSSVNYSANFYNLLSLDSHELYDILVSSGYYPDDIIASMFILQEEDGSVIYRVVFAVDEKQSGYAFVKVWFDEDSKIISCSYVS